MKKNYLKKLTVLTLTVAMAASMFTGCGNSAAPAATPAASNKKPAEYTGSVTVWSWNDELKTSTIIDKFNAIYPNVKINLVTIPNDNNAYTTKLQSTLSSGVGVPDVFLTESAYVKKFVNLDFYENLTKAPYNAEDLTKKMVPYTVKVGRNDKDNSIRALSWQATPGGFFYRRDMAKALLGTDSPDDIQKLVGTSIADFIKFGETIKDKSAGKITLLSDYSELANIARGSRTTGWVKDGKLVIDPKITDFIDQAVTVRKEGLDSKLADWSPAWTASMATTDATKGVFGYVLPTWGLQFVLQQNAPKATGNYGFVQAPTPYSWGGSWLGIAKASTNKDLAWQFVKCITTNVDFLTAYSKNDFVNNTDIQATVSASADGNNAFLAGQNVYKPYTALVKNVNGDLITEYDDTINNAFNADVDLFINGKIASKDALMTKFKADVKSAYPDINVG